MAQVTYRITLSVSGDHAVSVSGDDPVAVNDGLAWARGIYLKLKERAAVGNQASSSETTQTHHQAIDSLETTQPPSCARHKLPMVRMNGKRGEFWSCHEKLDDGSYCPYRPPK
jgi:hypothetical protein